MSDEIYRTMRQLYLDRGMVFLPDITNETTAQVIADLAEMASRKPNHINLRICSEGGVTDYGFTIAQFIEFELDIPVYAEVFGSCDSAATYVLLSCRRRAGNELATFVLHRQTARLELEYSPSFETEVTGWIKANQTTHERQILYYTRKLRLARCKVEEILDKGSAKTNSEISASEALQLGILTKVTKIKPCS